MMTLDEIEAKMDEAITYGCEYLKDYRDATKRNVDVAPVIHAHWADGMKCSNCGQVDFSKPNYCPYCGAKMDEEATNEKID